MRTISVAHATVTQNVSHAPVMPKYGFAVPNIFSIVPECASRVACREYEEVLK
jgi:hypothetical protein